MIINDVRSRLNPTIPGRLVRVDSLPSLRAAVIESRGSRVSVAGGRHAMGEQQFTSGGTVLDTRGLSRVLHLDLRRGLVEVEAGIQWPQLVAHLLAAQRGHRRQCGIAQKQTGANYFTIGGSVSANCHGRGLSMAPIVADVESLRLVRADGSVIMCGRGQNPELFRLVIGGYGLFGAIYSVTLRLAPRTKLERVVDVISVAQLRDEVPARISAGFRYGDFQFAIDPASPDFLDRGVFSCCRPVDSDRPIPADQRALPARLHEGGGDGASPHGGPPHTQEGVARSAQTFRCLIDLAIERGGSYYLTYHRWAEAEQIRACYPRFADFLALKRHHDPDELFHSDWYQHHADLFSGTEVAAAS